ncbi:MAG: cytochrome c [Myxococcaceae bacterium]|jgi:mono/diheme cytochrome c family protein|nr:cytochrome c [Myxococcaceae bacterium]MCA3012298.1 cytochrome c [Myxococcaceae bacterium]
MRVLSRALLSAATLAVTACGGMPPTPDAGSPMGNATNGQSLYVNRGCNGCHGTNAEGTSSGPNISGNMTAGIGAWTQAEFNRAIREGVGKDGVMFCANMPRTPVLNDSALADLFAFVKSKDSAAPQRGPAECR